MYFNSFMQAEPNELDCLILDEVSPDPRNFGQPVHQQEDARCRSLADR